MTTPLASPLRLALLAALALAGCSKQHVPAAAPHAPAAAAPLAPETPAATFTDANGLRRTVTVGEVDREIEGELARLEKERYEARVKAAEQLVVLRLAEAEARRRGLKDADALIAAEVDAKVSVPPEARVREVYEANRERLPKDATYEQVRPRIVAFLTQDERQEKARAFFDQLRARADVRTELAEPQGLRRKVEAVGPSRGPDDAPVTLVAFSDFECPYCGRAAPVVEQVLAAYPKDVRLVFRHFPLDFHPHAQRAAEAAACADEQGRFWAFHDRLFSHQDALEPEALEGYAAELGLDAKKFQECVASGRTRAAVARDVAAGRALGVSGTPAFFVNGLELSGAQPLEAFRRVIDGELAKRRP